MTNVTTGLASSSLSLAEHAIAVLSNEGSFVYAMTLFAVLAIALLILAAAMFLAMRIIWASLGDARSRRDNVTHIPADQAKSGRKGWIDRLEGWLKILLKYLL